MRLTESEDKRSKQLLQSC